MQRTSRDRAVGLTAGLVGLLLAGLPGCAGDRAVAGECRPVNGAEVCTWGMESDGNLVEFGATVPLASIENAQLDAPMVFPPKSLADIPLPDAVRAATGFDNLTIFWEAHGHPPGPYLVPHFDFHFNTASLAELAAIDCADTAKPARLPTAYALPDLTLPELGTLVGLCVPGMGMHAMPALELEATTPFGKTMVVGYYRQKPIYLEPMLAREELLQRRSFTVAVPDVPDRPATGRYPTHFRADWDSTAQSYRFVFSGLASARPR